jgi:hypothetical protein
VTSKGFKAGADGQKTNNGNHIEVVEGTLADKLNISPCIVTNHTGVCFLSVSVVT